MTTLGRYIKFVFTILIFINFVDVVAAAEYGFKVNGSTLGTGLELDLGFDSKWGVRLQQNSYDIDDEFEEDDIDYTGGIELSTLGVLADWHAFNGGFRLTAGFYLNDNKLVGRASGDGAYDIGDRTYISSSNDPVRLNLDVELGSSTSPFLGLGWGSSPKNTGGLLISFDMGVMLSGSPNVSLDVAGTATDTSTGFSVNLADDPTVQEEVNKEIRSLEDDISEFDLYPVIMLGIGYRF